MRIGELETWRLGRKRKGGWLYLGMGWDERTGKSQSFGRDIYLKAEFFKTSDYSILRENLTLSNHIS